ncbi:cell wall hydrolase [sulfur-oxidizing endosymbiont of Gigantopelta aegis]|uniref:cell wall hydrolase n=1 Tax=sulfur-oxidizing endosymbiont of Gigantopelta aegis TaxID=2794934 RepID=UPI0018DBC3D2|nr:cell wall hydrolase [sulfur-oxidizing endosymbiont of Gigantopelta aegis]
MELFAALAMCYALSNTQEFFDNNCHETFSTYQTQLTNIEISDEQMDAISKITYAEAGNQGSVGITAVTFVILNRLISKNFGDSIEQIINAKNQFEPATKSKGWKNLPEPSSSHKKEIKTILQLIQSGDLQDPTKGSLYFQNPLVVASREQQGKVSPGLTRFGNSKPSKVIKDHEFYHSINNDKAKTAVIPSWDIYRKAQEKQGWMIF